MQAVQPSPPIDAHGTIASGSGVLMRHSRGTGRKADAVITGGATDTITVTHASVI